MSARLVHRGTAEEVFLRSVSDEGDGRYHARLLLPRRHPYFTDHRPWPDDSLLCLEATRQVGSYLAHTALGVPLDAAFLVRGWTVSGVPPQRPGAPERSADLPVRADVTVTGVVRRGGQLRSARFTAAFFAEGVRLPTVDIEAGYATAEEYRALRTMQRGSPPPRSDTLRTDDRPRRLAPQLVGRGREENVLLAALVRDEVTATAQLAVDLRHPTLFGHANDHYTALTLTDAARQLTVAITRDRPVRPAGFTGLFQRFAELDQMVVLSAPDAGHAKEVVVSITQADVGLARIHVPLAADDTEDDR